MRSKNRSLTPDQTSPLVGCFRKVAIAGFTLAFLGVTMGTDSCTPSLVSDPGFDRWDGDGLEAWKLERGSIRKVPTWHRGDSGVELVEDDTAISQRLNGKSSCFSVVLLVDRDPEVTLQLELDFQDDGNVEYSTPVQVRGFELASFLITPPTWYQTSRIRIRKHGSGRAVLARVRIESSRDCSAPPIDLIGRPAGAACERADQCLAGHCDAGKCRACADCQGDELCGPGPTSAWPYDEAHVCLAPGSKAIGESCKSAEQCASGICEIETALRCSECAMDMQCKTRCDRHPMVDFPAFLGDQTAAEMYRPIVQPKVCDPGDGSRRSGERCLRDTDCASAVCEGTRFGMCLDSLMPCVADSDCLDDKKGVCSVIGAMDGRCR